jgi:putative inorganic carbon (HCO3(-)) transporter
VGTLNDKHLGGTTIMASPPNVWPEVLVAISAALLGSVIFWVFPTPLFPLLLLGIIAGGVLVTKYPWSICVLFSAVSLFRLHEAFPALLPLQLPNLGAALIIIALAVNVIGGHAPLFWSPQLSYLALFFGVATASGIFAINPGAAFTFWVAVYWKIALISFALAWLPRSLGDLYRITWGLVICGAAVAGVVIQHKMSGTDLVEGTRAAISGSALADPNDLAFVLILPLSLAICLFIDAKRASRAIVPLISALMIFCAVLFTQSRGAIIGLLASSAVIASRYIRSRGAILLGGVILTGILYSLMGIDERYRGPSASISSSQRLELWSVAVQTAVARPLTGVGLGNFQLQSFQSLGRMQAAHNTWLGVLAETGVLGFFLFSAMVISSLRGCLRLFSLPELGEKGARPLALGLAASLAGMSAAGLFITQGFNWPIYIVVALTAAMLGAGMQRRSL